MKPIPAPGSSIKPNKPAQIANPLMLKQPESIAPIFPGNKAESQNPLMKTPIIRSGQKDQPQS